MSDENVFLIAEKVAAVGDKPFIAFEYFPPRTEAGVVNLKKRLAKMKQLSPLYVDFTWGAGGTTSELTQELCLFSQKETKYVANMHLTCTNMPREKIDAALELSLKQNIRNVLALRGDPPVGQEDWKPVESGFSCALDLVEYIKEFEKKSNKADFFGISVAAYPEGHPTRINKVDAEKVASLSESEKLRTVTLEDGVYVCSDADYKEEMVYLKKKVDAGANMIVTQMFFDVDTFLAFKQSCVEYGINVPIIPGIMCITSYSGFKRMVTLCKSRVPQALADGLEAVKDDPKAVKEFGVSYTVDVCKRLLSEAKGPGLHFYTLNQDAVVVEVCKKLGLYEGEYSDAS